MSKANDLILFLKQKVRPDKIISFKDEKIQVDYDLLTRYSQYFLDKKESYKNSEVIILEDENLNDINIEIFKNFISCCQGEGLISLNNSNVFPLYQLSIIYTVPELTEYILDYIKKNQKDLIFQIIIFKSKMGKRAINFEFELILEEEIIASDIFYYINTDEIFSLPINVLYSILNNYNFKINQLNQTEQEQMINFLFKCLDKKGKEASVLFLNLDIENQPVEIISKLIDTYKNVFDFSMINSKILFKSINELFSNLSQLKIEYMMKFDEINQLLKAQNQKLSEETNYLKSIVNEQNEQLKNYENKLKQVEKNLNENYDQQIKQVEKNLNEKYDQQLKQVEKNLNEKYDQQIKQVEKNLNEKYDQQIKQVEKNLNEKQLTEPRAVLFSALSKDQKNYIIKLNKDKIIGLPLINMTPQENPFCTLEFSPNGSKITFKKSGTYQISFNISILGTQEKAILTPIQVYTKVNGGHCDIQFCSIPPTKKGWLSYSTQSNICKYKKDDNIVFFIRACADVELWGTTNCYTTFSLIYLNP